MNFRNVNFHESPITGQSYSHNFSSTSFHSFNNSATIVDYKRNRFAMLRLKCTFLRQKIKARLLREIFINSWSRVVEGICEGDKIYHNFIFHEKKRVESRSPSLTHIFKLSEHFMGVA